MNQADKQEALRLIARILHLTRPTIELDNLRALIERQNDTDGEMWRFCVEHGFPSFDWTRRFWVFDGHNHKTPSKTIQAAMAAMKEKA